MSKDLAFNENANIAWDLHEKNEIVPLEFTEENNVELFGIEPIKAKEMVSGLSVTLAEREVLKSTYIDVIDLPITTENLGTFKELRLKIVKNRTQGLKTWHTAQKAFYLNGGRFVDSIYNKEVLENEQMEAKLLEAEKFFENQEKEKARLLNLERIEKVKPYVEDVIGLDFSAMSDYDFDDYVLGKKTRFENEAKERKEKEEAELVEKRKDETLQKRQIEIAPYMQFVSNASELREMSERLYQDMLFNCKKAKTEFDFEVKKQAEENAKLKDEAELKEKALEKERAEVKAKADKLEAELRAGRLEQERKDSEELHALKLAADEREKLAKAPVKKQLSVWVSGFELPTTEVDNDISKEIKEKFEAFKKWSINQINNL